MFGLSKREKARKALTSALNFILVGRKEDRQRILSEMAGEIETITADTLSEADTYGAAVGLVQGYILNTLEELSVDDRVDLLERIATKRLAAPPPSLRLISHAAYCIAVLEDDAKSPIAGGATDNFLNTIADWFSDDEALKRRILRHLYKCTENHHAYLQQLKKENEERLRPRQG
jgi:hypothetical protein